MTTLFDRLGYNFETTQSNTIIEFSEKTLAHMNNIPELLTDWQKEDLANNVVGEYLKNPVSNVITYIRNTSNLIANLTNTTTGTSATINTYFLSIFSNANTIGTNNGGNFLAHTNRLSGVVNVSQSVAQTNDGELGQLPHYDTALAIGQVVMYLVYQTDGIQNNAPIMGNFTSILIQNELETYNTILQSHYTQINNSKTSSNTSNLSLSAVQAIYANTSNLNSLLITRRTSDELFYANSKQIVSEYKSVKSFTGMGLTANNLVQNFVGTDKLKSRINS